MSAEKKITLQIEGMDCNHCALSIAKTIEKRGLHEVNVNFATGEGSFMMPETTELAQVVQDIEKLGYKVTGQDKTGSSEKKIGFSTIEKKFLFCLVFTIPLLFHMAVHGGLLHDPWFQFALCLPVFTIGTLHFGKSAWGSLRAGVPNMDVLILIGTWSAFYYSLAGTILYSGTHLVHDYIFYETAATIITLVLLGNVLEHRSVKQTTTAIRELSALQISRTHRVTTHEDHEHLEEIDAASVQRSDVLQGIPECRCLLELPAHGRFLHEDRQAIDGVLPIPAEEPDDLVDALPVFLLRDLPDAEPRALAYLVIEACCG